MGAYTVSLTAGGGLLLSFDWLMFFLHAAKIISKTKKKESVLYYPMEEFAGIFFPAAKAVTEQIVNGDFD